MQFGLGVAALCTLAMPLAAETSSAVTDFIDTAREADIVVLGEIHDNPEHHRLQGELMHALAGGGPSRILAMEQFDREHQGALDAAQKRGASAEEIADAGQFDRKGWNWPLYRPLIEFALEHRWPIVAANLSRRDARAIAADPTRRPTCAVAAQRPVRPGNF